MEPLRFSILRWMGRSPAHAFYAMHNPTPDTPAMRLGRLAHAVALGTAIGPVWSGERRGNAWKAFRDEHAGKDIVTESEFETASGMASALLNHQEAKDLLAGTVETTVLFDIAGRQCRATPDVFTADLLTEVKSTTDASPDRFAHHALRMAYPAQLAWQRHALVSTGRAKPDCVSITAVETKPPFGVCVFRLTEAALEYGNRVWRSWYEEFRVAEEANHWPCYPMGIVDAPPEGLELVGADGEVLEID